MTSSTLPEIEAASDEEKETLQLLSNTCYTNNLNNWALFRGHFTLFLMMTGEKVDRNL